MSQLLPLWVNLSTLAVLEGQPAHGAYIDAELAAGRDVIRLDLWSGPADLSLFLDPTNEEDVKRVLAHAADLARVILVAPLPRIETLARRIPASARAVRHVAGDTRGNLTLRFLRRGSGDTARARLETFFRTLRVNPPATTRLRTMQPDYDFRRTPSTDLFCCVCQRDLAPDGAWRTVYILGGLKVPPGDILHPDDLARHVPTEDDIGRKPIGPECVHRVGVAWTSSRETHPLPDVASATPPVQEAPVCACVWCELDRETEQPQFRLRRQGAPERPTDPPYYNPIPGRPTWVTKAQAPLVGPSHVARAPGMLSEPA